MFSLLRKMFTARVLVLLLPETVLLFASYIAAAYWAGGADPSVFLLYDNGLLQISLAVTGVLAGLQLNRLYTQVGMRSKLLLLQQLLMAMGVTFLWESLLGYMRYPDLVLRPAIMVFGSIVALLALAAWRLFYRAALGKGFAPRRVLFYGTNSAALEASRNLDAHPEFGLVTAGYIDDTRASGTGLNGSRVLGSTADLARVVNEVNPDRIVVGVAERRSGVPFSTLLDLQFRGIEIQNVGELYELACERVCMDELLPSQIIFSGELEARRGAIALQAIYANLAALVGLGVLAAVIVPVALAIKLTSRGPVLDAQDRLGLNMVPFTLYRFRCDRADGTLTGLGRWLHRLHIDALPQLLNVVRGEMSLVGPRPHRPEFIPALMERMPYYGQRHAVRPGILGWSQLNCEYGGQPHDAREALEYDLYYIKHISPALDAYILLHSLVEAPFRAG